MQRGKETLLAIDVGTTTTRCILFDLDGRPLAQAQREPGALYPGPGRAESVPENWWAAVVAAIQETLQRAQVAAEQIAGIGLCGLKHAIVPLGADGTVLANAMLWMDQRCQPQVAWMVEKHGELLAKALGSRTMTSTPSAPKLRWIVENVPDLVQQTHVFLLAKDFIRYRLTGTIATDRSDAGGTGLYDRRQGRWSQSMLDLIGVPAAKMPPIRESTAVVGGVNRAAAQATGLVPGTPVVVGGGDVQCTLIGANAFSADGQAAPAHACLYLGTAAWLSTGTTLSADRFGATATTGAALKWLTTLFGCEAGSLADSASERYAALLLKAEHVPAGAEGLVFLPHLMGERGPVYDPTAQGVLYGLSMRHGRAEIACAVLEGSACQLRWIAEGLDTTLDEVVVTGGGAKSALWLQIIADVMGITLLVPRVIEAGSLGAAILAGVGVGVYGGIPDAARSLVQIVGRVTPSEVGRQQYDEVYATFRAVEKRVAPLYGGGSR